MLFRSGIIVQNYRYSGIMRQLTKRCIKIGGPVYIQKKEAICESFCLYFSTSLHSTRGSENEKLYVQYSTCDYSQHSTLNKHCLSEAKERESTQHTR